MEAFGRALTSGVAAAFSALAPGDDVSADETETVEITPPETPQEGLHQDWMVVIEEQSAVRSFVIDDLHVQRVRKRPNLTQLWDADNTDVLIEQPLVVAPSTARPFGSVSYAAVAQGASEGADEATAVQEHPATPAPELWGVEAPVYTRVGRHHGPCSRAASVLRGDIVDWLDLCKGDRVTRRYMSRQNRIKAYHGGATLYRSSAKKRGVRAASH
eukprot:m.26889 g.26889  ORF g.26889 m.26889 type:complete len:215 (+) comp6368_c0_seq1:343-987(+)